MIKLKCLQLGNFILNSSINLFFEENLFLFALNVSKLFRIGKPLNFYLQHK